ncbi:1-deoxy-D-xylulose-5-phosphate reductoisomerase [Aestuariibius insulae]|uniref:1-deoxy-D-xylulose-5-phosphate reductoisomerase n=1 Tax=Aestuariibius insulae TaxID=2058287 RepID=UPI00345EE21B
MRRVSVFGATGSVGRQTLDLIGRAAGEYQVVALSAGTDATALAELAREHRAELAVIADEAALPELRARLTGSGIEAAGGPGALVEAAEREADWVMSAIVGAAGIAVSLAVAGRGGTLALANKETLVAAGPLLMAAAERSGATILPVDSEHSAVFQALAGEDLRSVERVIITASGGAFRNRPLEELAHVTVDEASSHPNWDMGQRITIDSASMFNKALELIETKEFFGIPPEKIETVVHPESLVHALVGYIDGALMAHVGPPDMRHAIGYALHWPERRDLPVARLDLAEIGQLTFRAPDPARYPALDLARRVMETGGRAGAAFNAAKEQALDGFIAGQIGFLRMAEVVEGTLDAMSAENGLGNAVDDLDMVMETDRTARDYARRLMRADRE